jgi:hypothetical protein
MTRRTRWDNEDMWQQAEARRRGGATYREIEAWLSLEENLRRFSLEAIPSEDTIRRSLKRRMIAQPLGSSHAWLQRPEVKDLLLAIRADVQNKFSPYPTVWHGYRPDPSNGLRWETEGGVKSIKWSFPFEHDFLWPSFLTGFQAHLTTAAKALNTVNAYYARYCQRLVELEDYYREGANQAVKGGLDQVALNDSYFFRSVLHEVDSNEPSPVSNCQYAITPTHEGVSVAYLGVVLLEAPKEASAREWIGLHLEWRREIDRGEVLQLRELTLEAARSLVADIEEVIARSIS